MVQIVNGVLHGTDEYGQPFRSVDVLARAVVEACVSTEDDVVVFKVTPAEYNEIIKLGPPPTASRCQKQANTHTKKVVHAEEHLAVGSRRVNLIVEKTSRSSRVRTLFKVGDKVRDKRTGQEGVIAEITSQWTVIVEPMGGYGNPGLEKIS